MKSKSPYYKLTRTGKELANINQSGEIFQIIDKLEQIIIAKSKRLLSTIAQAYYIAREDAEGDITEKHIKSAMRKLGWNVSKDEMNRIIENMVNLGLITRSAK